MHQLTRFFGMFTSNIGWKLIALICSFGIWAYITSTESQTGYFPGDLPIEIRNISPNLVLINEKEKVKVKLRAPFKIWGRINVDNLKADANLAGLQKGIHEVDINITTNLQNLIILEKEPSKMIVRLEEVIEKDIPVNVLLEGEAKAGYIASDTITEPETIKIKGPESLVNEITQQDVEVNISGKSRDFFQKVYLNDKKVNFRPMSVNVLVNIISESGSKTVGIKVNTKGKLKPNYYISKIESIPSVVDISSKENIISQINFLETAEIDLEKLDKSSVEDANLIIPDKIFSKVKKVKIKIFLSPNFLERQIIATFDYQSNPDFRIADIQPVKVMVSGPANVINNLSSDQVVIKLDFIGNDYGVSPIYITREMISVPKGTHIVLWTPNQINVNLVKN